MVLFHSTDNHQPSIICKILLLKDWTAFDRERSILEEERKGKKGRKDGKKGGKEIR